MDNFITHDYFAGFEVDGEMAADVALSREAMKLYPFCRLSDTANVLIMPAIHSAAISTQLIKVLGGAEVMGPILLGLTRAVQICPLGSNVSKILQMATVCAYDRAGQGWSDPPASPQDGVAVATDLHTLLDHAQIPGPYVLVGHSTGGVYIRVFAARYPDQVAGMVLLDSQPNEAFTGLPGFPSFYSTIRRASALFPSLARVGLFRLVNQFASDPLPVPTRDEERAVISTADLNRIQRDEFAELPMSLKEAAALTTLGDRPLIVVTAAKGTQTGWLPLQDKMTGLSTNSVHRVLPDTDHPGLIHDRAGATQASQAILDVVASVRSGIPLRNLEPPS